MVARFLRAWTARLTLAIVCSFQLVGGGSAAQHLADVPGVARGHHHLVGEAPGPPGRLLLENVAAERLPAHELARARRPEALGRTPVRLHLRHFWISWLML